MTYRVDYDGTLSKEEMEKGLEIGGGLRILSDGSIVDDYEKKEWWPDRTPRDY